MSNWPRVRKDRPCPICRDIDWCGISPDEAAVICMRISEGAVKQTRNGGWLHLLNAGAERPWSGVRVASIPERNASRNDLPTLAQRYATAINPERLRRLAAELGVSVESLRRLRIGWATDERAWSFPMQDAEERVIGIRLRRPGGQKYSVVGGREGLFMPIDLEAGGELLVTEGPTDCAALLDLGFAAVGRPCCTGGVRLLVAIAKLRRPAAVVIVADADEPGMRGAEALAAVLVVYTPIVRIVRPPDGVKDARAWRQAGATRETVREAIDAAPVRRAQLGGEGVGA